VPQDVRFQICTKFHLHLGSAPDPAAGAYSVPETRWLYLLMSAVFNIKLALSACDLLHRTVLLFQSDQHEVYLHVSDATSDQSTYTLYVDGSNICSSTSIDKAFGLLFLASYVFNLVVPKTMRCTVAFVSKLACAIDNSTGQDKILKAAQNKCTTLIEKLAKFNGTIRQRKSRRESPVQSARTDESPDRLSSRKSAKTSSKSARTDESPDRLSSRESPVQSACTGESSANE